MTTVTAMRPTEADYQWEEDRDPAHPANCDKEDIDDELPER